MSPPAELVEKLRAAAAAVDEADLRPEVRAAGFVLAFWELGGPSAPAGGAGGSMTPESGAVGAGLTQRLGIAAARLDGIYDVDDESVNLIVPRRALSASRRDAMAEVIHLTAAGRQGLGLEEWTPTEIVRQQCEDRGVLDGNFAAVLGKLDGRGMRVRGRGKSREVKLNAAGFEETGRLIERLLAQLA